MQKKSLLIIIGLAILVIAVAYVMFGIDRQTLTEEIDPLNIPGDDATTQERQMHFEAAMNAAETKSPLDITGCEPDPTVLRVGNGELFEVKNDDSTEHILLFDEDHVYRIAGNSTVNIEADFGNGVGLYSYVCDFSSEADGLIFVE